MCNLFCNGDRIKKKKGNDDKFMTNPVHRVHLHFTFSSAACLLQGLKKPTSCFSCYTLGHNIPAYDSVINRSPDMQQKKRTKKKEHKPNSKAL